MSTDTTYFSISAHLDLLGFSNHLILSNGDVRTTIGKEAIERLRIIESAIEIIENELDTYNNLYPETFRFQRFNDSLMFGIDIDPLISPRIGRPNERATLSLEEFNKTISNLNEKEERNKHLVNLINSESFKVCKFLGVVSRIHNYINQKEYDLNMPGCRTVVSSGLRSKFINKKNGNEDYYSANFSLSNAFHVNELGSKGGFSGNKCYIEDNVAEICGENLSAKRILGYSCFVKEEFPLDPFEGKETQLFYYKYRFKKSEKIRVNLFNRNYQFREFNTIVGSFMQIAEGLTLIANENQKKKSSETSLLDAVINLLVHNTIDIDKLNTLIEGDKNAVPMLYPILFFGIGVNDKDLLEQFNRIKEL